MIKPYEFRGNAYRNQVDLAAWTNQRTEEALEADLPIIDAHHHVWDDERGRYLIEEFAADLDSGHNIRATLFVEAGAMYRAYGDEPMKTVGEVEFVNGVAAMGANGRYGPTRICAGIVGHADLTQGEKVRPVLETLIAAGHGRFRGIRHGVTWDTGNAAKFGKRQAPQHELLDPVFRKGFACLEPLGLTFEAWQFHPQLPDLVDLLGAFPNTPVILNHVGGLLGIPPHEGNRKVVFDVWRRHIKTLARFPNLSVKLGGLGMLYCGWDFHLREMPPSSEELASIWRPYIETCIEEFGTERCMMESNFPVDKQSCGYGVLWNAMKRITQNFSAAEKSDLYFNNAQRVYRISC